MGVKNKVKDGSGVIVPCGAKHNVVNTSKTTNLNLNTIYSPPEHQGQGCPEDEAGDPCAGERYDGKPTEK